MTNIREERILQQGLEIWQQIQKDIPAIFNKESWQGKLIELAMRDPEFKGDLLRFIDALQEPQNTTQIQKRINEYILKKNRKLPPAIHTAFEAITKPKTPNDTTPTLLDQILSIGQNFKVGSDPISAIPKLQQLRKEGMAFSFDLLHESSRNNKDADEVQKKYLNLIDTLTTEVNTWDNDPVIDQCHRGEIPRLHFCIKTSALTPGFDATKPETRINHIKKRLFPILLKVIKRNAFIRIVHEQWEYHETTLAIFESIINNDQFKSYPHIGIVIQAYLRSAQEDAERLLQLAKKRETPIPVRLVKGAYWDYEIARAHRSGAPCPVFTDKAATDINYEKLTHFLLQNYQYLPPAFASHNLRSLANTIVLADELKVPKNALEIQVLYGMAEPFRKAFRSLGYRVRVYTPVGENLPGKAYQLRRLQEITANDGFLRRLYHETEPIEKLLKKPQPKPEKSS